MEVFETPKWGVKALAEAKSKRMNRIVIASNNNDRFGNDLNKKKIMRPKNRFSLHRRSDVDMTSRCDVADLVEPRFY